MFSLVDIVQVMKEQKYTNATDFDDLWRTVSETYDQENQLPLISSILGYLILTFSTVFGTVANLLVLRYFFTRNNIFFNAF